MRGYSQKQYERVCDYCQGEFIAIRSDTRFCSATCRKAFSSDKHRKRCCECGAVMGTGTAWTAKTRCVPCENVRRTKGVRAAEFERLWNEGKTLREIQEALDMSGGLVRKTLFVLRERGYDLPYRRSAEGRANIQAGIRQALGGQS